MEVSLSCRQPSRRHGQLPAYCQTRSGCARRFLKRAIGQHGLPDKITTDKSGINTDVIHPIQADVAAYIWSACGRSRHAAGRAAADVGTCFVRHDYDLCDDGRPAKNEDGTGPLGEEDEIKALDLDQEEQALSVIEVAANARARKRGRKRPALFSLPPRKVDSPLPTSSISWSPERRIPLAFSRADFLIATGQP